MTTSLVPPEICDAKTIHIDEAEIGRCGPPSDFEDVSERALDWCPLAHCANAANC
jgi:hypothetical protein